MPLASAGKDPRAKDASIIGAKMDHLNKIVEQILDFARSTEPRLVPVNLNQILEDLGLRLRLELLDRVGERHPGRHDQRRPCHVGEDGARRRVQDVTEVHDADDAACVLAERALSRALAEGDTCVALSRLAAQDRALDVSAANLANAATPGFQAERMVFADWLDEHADTFAVPEHARQRALFIRADTAAARLDENAPARLRWELIEKPRREEGAWLKATYPPELLSPERSGGALRRGFPWWVRLAPAQFLANASHVLALAPAPART